MPSSRQGEARAPGESVCQISALLSGARGSRGLASIVEDRPGQRDPFSGASPPPCAPALVLGPGVESAGRETEDGHHPRRLFPPRVTRSFSALSSRGADGCSRGRAGQFPARFRAAGKAGASSFQPPPGTSKGGGRAVRLGSEALAGPRGTLPREVPRGSAKGLLDPQAGTREGLSPEGIGRPPRSPPELGRLDGGATFPPPSLLRESASPPTATLPAKEWAIGGGVRVVLLLPLLATTEFCNLHNG